MASPRRLSGCLANVNRSKKMGINKDQVAGRAKEVAGNVKEAVGKVIGSDKLEVKGKIEKDTGLVQAKVGDIKKEVHDATKPA
jgi:uncharacterized protein YjbJ (UPF0337 family)